MCDGSAVSRTTYASLFAIISTGWGAGDGSTTFNLPDFRGREPVGIGTHSDVNALGKSDNIATVGDRRPKHKHTVNDPTHVHAGATPVYSEIPMSGNLGGLYQAGGGTTGAAATGVTVGTQTNAPTDSAAFLVVPFIIKT